MSVVKSKRSQSKVEFEMIYLNVAEGIDRLTENKFFADPDTLYNNQVFLATRSHTLQRLSDTLLYPYTKFTNW